MQFPENGEGVMINLRNWSTDLEILFFQCQGGKLYAGEGIQYHEVPKGHQIIPTAYLNRSMAQQLMDELYRAGVRPTEAADNAGELKGTKAHLADMRRLVFDAPGAIAHKEDVS
jgi:hypothetical protein